MNPNSKCPSCGASGAMAPGTTELRSVVGPRVFVAAVPAMVCATCGEAIIAGEHLRAFEAARSRALATEGAADGAALRWMRKAARLSGVDLARLLGVAPEAVARWENDAQPADRATAAVIAELALDALDGRTTTRERLDALAREPRSDGTPHRLDLSAPRAA